MRIQRKVVHQLLLTPSELNQLMDMIREAEQGKTVHYSERQQPNGSFFGIGIDAAYEDRQQRPKDIPVADRY